MSPGMRAAGFLLVPVLAGALGAQAPLAPTRSRSARAPHAVFSSQVVRIFQEHCQSCHHPGEVAPFSLMEYAESKLYSEAIKFNVERRYMPPWQPAPGVGKFIGERRLSEAEISTLVRWAKAGAPQGDPRLAPPPLLFSDRWTLGEPDLVLELERPTRPTRTATTTTAVSACRAACLPTRRSAPSKCSQTTGASSIT